MKLKLSFVLLLSLLTSCSSVPDIPACTRLGVDRGFCVWTISNREEEINDTNKLEGNTWLDIVYKSVILPPESWAKIKKYIINNCRKNQDCAKDIDSWNRKIEIIDSGIK